MRFFLRLFRRERRAAAASFPSSSILERETETHYVLDIVDFDSVQILRAEHIDEQAHTLFVEDKIALA